MWQESSFPTFERTAFGDLEAPLAFAWKAHGLVFAVRLVGDEWQLSCSQLNRRITVLQAAPGDALAAKLEATRLIGERLRVLVVALRDTVKLLQGQCAPSSETTVAAPTSSD